MTTLYSLATGDQFLIEADTTGDLDFRVASSAVGFTLLDSGAVTLSNKALALPTSDPSSPEIGMLRFNTSSNKFEGYNGTSWAEFVS